MKGVKRAYWVTAIWFMVLMMAGYRIGGVEFLKFMGGMATVVITFLLIIWVVYTLLE